MTAERHVEHQIVPGRRLGRRPHDPSRPVLKLGPLLTGVIPDHPATVDHATGVTFGLYQNDTYGDCGPTSVANSRRLTTALLTATEQDPSQDAVFDLYRRSGNPGFPAEDNGVVMADMLSEVLHGGIGDTRCLAYASVDTSNLDEVRAAVAIFGFLLLGVDLDTAQQTQTDSGLWDYAPSSPWGGHAVAAVRYSDAPGTVTDRLGVVTWGQIVDCTDTFLARQCPEAWVVLWPEITGSRAFLEGVNQEALASAYEALTGRTFPVAPTPGPTPTPVPPGPTPVPPAPVVDVADRALWAAVQPVLTHLPHHWAVAKVHRALDKWHTDKGGF